jgi:hypothetical protein
MHQKDLVRDAWRSAHLYVASDPKLQPFLDMLDDPTQCWSELVNACRRSYAAYKARVVEPILASGDKLVHLMIIRFASEAYEDEMALLEQYIASSDPALDEVELKTIALKRIPRLDKALNKKPNLPKDVNAMIAPQIPFANQPLVAQPPHLSRQSRSKKRKTKPRRSESRR